MVPLPDWISQKFMCGYRLSFTLQTRASASHRIATIPFYQGIIAILSFCVLDTINFSNNPSFPSLFLNSDDSIRIVMILTKKCNDSSRNVTILTQNVTDSTEKCQFHPSSFAQLQSTWSKKLLTNFIFSIDIHYLFFTICMVKTKWLLRVDF